MPKQQKMRERAEGQILVLFAGGLVVFLLLIGLVIDGGVAFLNRRDAQNTADLASLAGTKVVADLYVKGSSPVSVYDAIEASAQGNNCLGASDPTPCTWTASYVGITRNDLGAVTQGSTPPSGTFGVQVNVVRQPVTFIAGPAICMLNGGSLDAWNVQTVATAMTYQSNQVAPAGAMLPIGWRARPTGLHLQPGLQLHDRWPGCPGQLRLAVLGRQRIDSCPQRVGLPAEQPRDHPAGLRRGQYRRIQLEHHQGLPPALHRPEDPGPDPGDRRGRSSTACPNGVVTGTGSSSEYCVVGVVSVILTDYTLQGNVAIKEI